ncbi:hypothetical protein AAG570_007959 [Ranatra chinensis]|uniref:NSFL1 cofactor p47 n=1 Tax=Ranatra chinensis TaxID=642074 RepID=A0ABD0Y8L5_9HEMI
MPSLRGPGDDNRRRDVTLRLWREGFSVDDGPMRDYTSQENIAFLNEIRRGNIPNELLNEAEGGTVHLNMEDHRHESYVPIKSKVRAFAGKGHVLGSPTPAISSGNVRETAGATESRPANPSNNLNINPALPITTIQIRLADGSRLQATLNYTHTIADVRRYIIDNRPEFADRAFTLLTSFPSRELTQDTLTIEEAGLLGASILQRLL